MKRIITAVVTLAATLTAGFALAAEPVKEVRIGYQAASTIILLGKAKGYYDSTGTIYYVRLNSRNNADRLNAIFEAYGLLDLLT